MFYFNWSQSSVQTRFTFWNLINTIDYDGDFCTHSPSLNPFYGRPHFSHSLSFLFFDKASRPLSRAHTITLVEPGAHRNSATPSTSRPPLPSLHRSSSFVASSSPIHHGEPRGLIAFFHHRAVVSLPWSSHSGTSCGAHTWTPMGVHEWGQHL